MTMQELEHLAQIRDQITALAAVDDEVNLYINEAFLLHIIDRQTDLLSQLLHDLTRRFVTQDSRTNTQHCMLCGSNHITNRRESHLDRCPIAMIQREVFPVVRGKDI